MQGLGFAGLALFVGSFQLLNPRHTMLMQCPANIIMGFHYMGLGAEYLMFIAFIASVRDLCFVFGSDKGRPYFLGGYLGVLYGGAFFLASGVADYCGLIGSTLTSAAQFFRDRFYLYRGLSMGHQLFWLIANTLVFSISGVVFMTGLLVSNLIGMARYALAARTDRSGS